MKNEDIWGVLMTELFNEGGTGITGDEKLLIFDLLTLLINPRLSRGVFCEELDECLQTKDSWGGLMTELLNGGGTGITSGYN